MKTLLKLAVIITLYWGNGQVMWKGGDKDMMAFSRTETGAMIVRFADGSEIGSPFWKLDRSAS